MQRSPRKRKGAEPAWGTWTAGSRTLQGATVNVGTVADLRVWSTFLLPLLQKTSSVLAGPEVFSYLTQSNYSRLGGGTQRLGFVINELSNIKNILIDLVYEDIHCHLKLSYFTVNRNTGKKQKAAGDFCQGSFQQRLKGSSWSHNRS